MRNEKLKAESYAQYLKLTPPNQIRLMSAFDIKEGNMQMSFIKPIVQQPRTSVDFNDIEFEVLARGILPIDQIEFHNKGREMIYSTLTGKEIVAHQL